MSTFPRLTCLCLLMAFLGASAGCLAVAAAGAAGVTVAYVRGNAEGLMEADPARIGAAAEAVLESVGVESIQREHNEADRRWWLSGKTASGESIKVTIQQLAPEVCKVWVRVGFLGNEQYSLTIFESIQARL